MLASLHSKASDLEEELKNVTNNLKSLEAQSEKVRVSCGIWVIYSMHGNDWTLQQKYIYTFL